jgi:hypothetical protein
MDTANLLQVGIPKPIVDRLTFTFDCMEVAEQEISSGRARYPDKKDEINALFEFLCPVPGMQEVGTLLYRAYVKELVERTATGQSINLATDAEVIMVLAAASATTPLSSDATKLYFDIFKKLFPNDPLSRDIQPMYETYVGACEQLKQAIVTRLGKIDRSKN